MKENKINIYIFNPQTFERATTEGPIPFSNKCLWRLGKYRNMLSQKTKQAILGRLL